MVNFEGTPYTFSNSAGGELLTHLQQLEARRQLLREHGKLSEQTLARYYGKTRFQQIAESNAIEGSTLSVGETELAVLKGITISGHDPAYSRDARSLARALARLAELAKTGRPVDIQEVKELHELILEGRPGAGVFRSQEVRISGSPHRPPRTWREVMRAMEEWEAWSLAQATAPAPLRATVLHAWFVHIHPFIDGNGRTARALGNLELIRAGYPPVIIRARKDRSRYLAALKTSDEGGDLTLLFDLIMERLEDALRDLERAAAEVEGIGAQVQKVQESRLAIWNAAVQLLVELLSFRLQQALQASGGRVQVESFRDSLSVEDYLSLCEGQPAGRSWVFRVECEVPGLAPVERLAWAGFRSQALPAGAAAGPALFWSVRNPRHYPPWRKAEGQEAPGAEELTLVGERWYARRGTTVESFSSEELANRIARDLQASLTAAPAGS